METTVAASPATFLAISAITVKVVMTFSLSASLFSAFSSLCLPQALAKIVASSIRAQDLETTKSFTADEIAEQCSRVRKDMSVGLNVVKRVDPEYGSKFSLY